MTFTEDKRHGLKWPAKLFLSEEYSDCSVWVKNADSTIRFPCHKAVLLSNSNIFINILEDPNQVNSGVIVMEDTNAEAMAKVLEYMYLGCTEVKHWRFACDIMKIAFKYEIPKLIHQCEDYLLKNITLQNICHILEVAIFSNSEKLERTCMNICMDNCFVILNTDEFQAANRDIVLRILSQPYLQIENEMSVFKAVWKWATYRCCKTNKALFDENIVSEMDLVLECVGFEFMSPEEIKTIPFAAIKKFQELFPGLKLCVDYENYQNGSNDESYCKMAVEHKVWDGNVNNTSCGVCLGRLKEGRKIAFPLRSYPYCKKFEFHKGSAESILLIGNIILMRFSVNTRSYLERIDIDYIKTETEELEEFFTLAVHNRNGKLASFSRSGSGNLHNKSTIPPLSLRATELIVVEPYEEYTIEVNRDTGSCNVSWPLTFLNCERLGNVEISLLTKRCYGIKKISFIEAS